MPPSKDRRKAPAKCLCGCGEPVHCRGLSAACYHAARRRVAGEKTTWAELEEAGDALPPLPPNKRQKPNRLGAKIDKRLAASRG